MPKRKYLARRKRAFAKRRKKTRKVFANRSNGYKTVVIARDPFPKVMMVKMHYQGSSSVTNPLTDSPCEIAFNANSVYAPQLSGGHQPRFHDQLALIYGRYRVNKCRLTVYCKETTGSDHNSLFGELGIHINDSKSSMYSDYGDTYDCYSEIPNTTARVRAMSYYSAAVPRVTKVWRRKTKTIDKGANNDFGVTGADPGTTQVMHAYWNPHNAGSSTITVHFIYRLTYWVEWSDRKISADS